MSVFQFRLPDIGEGVAEAEITAWYVKVGDAVAEDQSLVDVMTDKATIDMTSPVTGKVLALHGEPGDKLAVGSVLVEIEIEGTAEEGGSQPTAPEPATQPTSVAPSTPATPPTIASPVTPASPAEAGAQQPVPTQPVPVSAPTPRSVTPAVSRGEVSAAPAIPASAPTTDILASPATRRRAEDLGIDLAQVEASGPEGRITDADLDAHLKARQPAPAQRERTGVRAVKVIGLRRKIAERMELAARRIPHFAYVEECDMTAIEGLRREINAARQGSQPKLTLLPFFMRALAQLLPEFPNVNAHYDDEAGVLQQHDAVHIGIATQTADGLMVPVVRHVEALDIWDCAREMSRVTNAAREGAASREDLSGSTITLTSLGALGGIAATPIINHPEVAIIGPNKLVGRPVMINNHITVRTMMNLSSSFDHRIVDGYDAARFIQKLKRLLENPALIFIEKRSWS